MFKRFLPAVFIAMITLSLTGCGYNTILRNDENVKAAWGDVEAQYQRRLNLIPNLVNTVKGYAKHEKETLQAVVDARSRATSVQATPELIKDKNAFADFQKNQNNISGALSRLLLVVEKYPDLKADQNFKDLMHQLEGTENRISVSVQRFNEAVRIYNTSIRVFPNSLTNSIFLKMEVKESFKAEAGAEKAPEVKFE